MKGEEEYREQNSVRVLNADSEPLDEVMLADVPRDSLKIRYFFKIISNMVGLVSNVFVQAIAPRSLGPQAFGDFNFLTNFFDQMLEMVDGRSSVGALVKVSLRPNESGLLVFYLYFAVLASAFVFAVTGLAFVFRIDQLIWPGQIGEFIFLAALWSVLVWLHGVLHKLCDAFGYTREAEWVRIQQKILSVILLGAMLFYSKITLETFFYYYIFLLLYLLVGFAMILIWKGRWPKLHDWVLPFGRARAYLAEFFAYSSPLFTYVAVEAIVAVVDRWVLQKFSGSEEQGYFGFAYQMGYISVLFVGSISPLIQREFSVAFASKNFTHMAYLFRRYMPMMFSIAAFFTGFIAFQSEKLIHLFAGQRFSESLWVISIMAFYPIYFTFGRVTSSVFYATGETQLFRNLGLVVQGAGLVMSWLLIAPHAYGGLDMGAVGLAWKLVAVQALLVNIQVWFSSRLLRISFREYFSHQAICLTMFLAIGYLARFVVDDLVTRHSQTDLVEFLFGGMAYCALVGGITYVMPSLFGVHRSDITQVLKYVAKLLRIPEKKVVLRPLTSLPLGNQPYREGKSLRLAVLGARNSIHAIRWANAMIERGHEVHFISQHPADNESLLPGAREYRLPFPSRWGYPAYFLNVPKVRALLNKIQPDVIHVHYASGYGSLATLATNKPVVLSAWGSDIFDIPKRSLLYGYFVRKVLERASAVTAASEALGNACAAEIKKDKPIFVLPFGVDTELFSPDRAKSSSKIRIGSIKSLEPVYGIDILVRAFAMVYERAKKEPIELELILVGKGKQAPLIANMVRELGIGSVTSFRGSLPHAQIPDVLGEMDIFVAPSRSESFGVALIEASATGIPVIGSRVGGIPEVVEDGVTGLLVRPDRTQELADTLWRLIKDQRLRVQLGQNGRDKVVREFSWQASVTGMETLYYQYGLKSD
ncbi:MAG TPA: glycosyltransferase [Bdellovibrionales bacterium]|nr:glycosyltransferase [Bdellovibrionales bacterium]